MKKNILAENMLRFGVKNLSESDMTRLTEADDQEAAAIEAEAEKIPEDQDPASGPIPKLLQRIENFLKAKVANANKLSRVLKFRLRRLFKKNPALFRKRYPTISTHCMGWGDNPKHQPGKKSM